MIALIVLIMLIIVLVLQFIVCIGLIRNKKWSLDLVGAIIEFIPDIIQNLYLNKIQRIKPCNSCIWKAGKTATCLLYCTNHSQWTPTVEFLFKKKVKRCLKV